MKTQNMAALMLTTCGVLLAGAGLAGGVGSDLIINGKVATTDVRVINGRVYVPLDDIAKAQNQVVMHRGSHYELTTAGGANQVEGKRRGNIGDMLFTGDWRFQVVRVETADKYTDKYLAEPETVEPTGKQNKLFIVTCRLKNARNESHTPRLHPDTAKNTALADKDGHSYPPIHFDVRRSGHYDGAKLLPGAALDFAVVFSVPSDVEPKSLVFTITTDDGSVPDTDVRVSLEDSKDKQ